MAADAEISADSRQAATSNDIAVARPRFRRKLALPKGGACVDLPASKLKMTALLELTGMLAQTPVVQDDRAKMLQTFGLMAFMALAMYLLMFRPQQKNKAIKR